MIVLFFFLMSPQTYIYGYVELGRCLPSTHFPLKTTTNSSNILTLTRVLLVWHRSPTPTPGTSAPRTCAPSLLQSLWHFSTAEFTREAWEHTWPFSLGRTSFVMVPSQLEGIQSSCKSFYTYACCSSTLWLSKVKTTWRSFIRLSRSVNSNLPPISVRYWSELSF